MDPPTCSPNLVSEQRKVIWEKIFDPETEELMNQEWFDINEIWQDIDEIIEFDLNDLEIQYSD